MSKSSTLLESVKTFYDRQEHSDILIDILEKRKGISLRNLEWFITNYSKKTNLKFTTNKGTTFTVHCSYKSTLDGYSKKLFDPFCRAEKIDFNLANGTHIKTTVAQLNFIKWCITNNIIEYIHDHKDILKSVHSTPQVS